MADKQIGNIHGVAATSVGNSTNQKSSSNINTSGAVGDREGLVISNVETIGEARKVLLANGYSNSTLDSLTYNDMIYAVRLLKNPKSVNGGV